MRKIYCFICLLIVLGTLLSIPSQAQDGKYSTTSKKAIKLYEEAQGFLPMGEYEVAIHNLNLAIEKDPMFMEAYIVLGDIYVQQKETKRALAAYKMVIEKSPHFFPLIYFTAGHLQMTLEDYSSARVSFEQFLAHEPRDPKKISLTKQAIANCDFAVEAMRHPVLFNPQNLGPNINSKEQEYYPSLTADEQTFLYTRRLTDPRSLEGYNEDFYQSIKREGEWLPSRNMLAPINSINNEGAPTLSADGQLLIFTACDLYGDRDYGPNRRGYGSCDLFISQRVGNKWMAPKNLGPAINTAHWETQPSFSADGKTLYYIRGIGRGPNKKQDIWYAELNDSGKWNKAQKLSDEINTPEREESVFIHPDGRTLYFSSNGHLGMGGLDIYKTQKDEDGNWGKPVNLGYPINTSSNENSLLVSASGRLAYFASDREGGLGDLDLYSFEMPEGLRPDLVTYLKGKIYDIETKKPLVAKFELIDLSTGKQVVQSFSNRGSGEFLVSLPGSKEYALNVARKGYLFHSENFELSEMVSGSEPYRKDIPLKPIREGENVVLKNVFFDTDKFDLKPKSKTELGKLVSLLHTQAEMKIEVGGHTDNVGDEKENQVLSENRAKAVYDYLTTEGIDASRLTYKGYGESKPLDGNTNSTEEERANNRRTEFTVISL